MKLEWNRAAISMYGHLVCFRDGVQASGEQVGVLNGTETINYPYRKNKSKSLPYIITKNIFVRESIEIYI